MKRIIKTFIYLAIGMIATHLGCMAIAHAGVDPTAVTNTNVDASWQLVTDYGPIWAIALLLNAGIAAFLRRNESQHWIAQGRALAALTGLASVLGSVIAWRLSGAPLEGVLVTIVMGLKLVWTPTVTPAPTPVLPPRDSQSGRVAMWPLIILAGSAIGIASQAMWFTGCADATRAETAGKAAVLDCAKPQVATAAALVARWGVEAAIAGKVDWAKIEADAEGFGIGVGSCGYAEFLRAWKHRPVPQAATLGAVPDDAQAGLERLRAKLGGAQIKLADGTIL